MWGLPNICAAPSDVGDHSSHPPGALPTWYNDGKHMEHIALRRWWKGRPNCQGARFVHLSRLLVRNLATMQSNLP
jgi:hypothetical protein